MEIITILDPDNGLNFEWRQPFIPTNQTYGAFVAIREWFMGMLKYGDFDSMVLYCPRTSYNDVAHNLEQIPSDYRKRVTLKDLRDLPTALEQDGDKIIHNPGQLAGVNLWRLRKNISPFPFPVTSLNHTFSYPWMRTTILDLLNEDILPCDGIICPSMSAANQLIELVNDVGKDIDETNREALIKRIITFPFGVDIHYFKPRNKIEVRQLLGLPENSEIFLWMGRLSPFDKADLTPLLRIFKKLKIENPDKNPILLVAGNDKYGYSSLLTELSVRLEINDSVLIWTELPTCIIPLLYSSADVFVSPVDNLHETFGISVLEAMSSGLPVIASDLSGYRELIREDSTGYLIKTRWSNIDRFLEPVEGINSWLESHFIASQSIVVDMEHFYKRMDLLLNNEDLRLSMSQKSREHVLNNYSWEKVISLLEAYWKDLIKVSQSVPFTIKPKSFGWYKQYRHCPSQCSEEDIKYDIIQNPILEIEELISLYDISSFIDLQKITYILKEIEKGFSTNKIKEKSTSIPAHEVNFYLQWLHKHGFISVK